MSPAGQRGMDAGRISDHLYPGHNYATVTRTFPVGLGGIEPPTSALSVLLERSCDHRRIVFEALTSALFST